MEPIEKLQSQVEELSAQYKETLAVLQTAANLIERNSDDLKYLTGRVDKNAESIVNISRYRI